MVVTNNIADYVDSIGVNLSELSRKTGIPYGSLYASLAKEGRGRDLRADELAEVCKVLKINPMDFADKKE